MICAILRHDSEANLLKPALARVELQCIGANTLDEYRKYIEKDWVGDADGDYENMEKHGNQEKTIENR